MMHTHSRFVRGSALYAIVMGVAMLATWAVLLATGQVTELATSPVEATLLLVAEILTGACLLFGGYGILTRRGWGLRLHLVSLGMVLYTAIYSIGIFGQQGILPATLFFCVVALATAAVVVALTFGRPRSDQHHRIDTASRESVL